MKYRKFTGIVLKKQNYREADQIVTVWTRENGKVRFLAKGLRKPTSKLNYNLQDLSFVSFEVAGSKHLPTLISVVMSRSFKHLRSDLNKIGSAIFAAELMLRMTADEQPNPQ